MNSAWVKQGWLLPLSLLGAAVVCGALCCNTEKSWKCYQPWLVRQGEPRAWDEVMLTGWDWVWRLWAFSNSGGWVHAYFTSNNRARGKGGCSGTSLSVHSGGRRQVIPWITHSWIFTVVLRRVCPLIIGLKGSTTLVLWHTPFWDSCLKWALSLPPARKVKVWFSKSNSLGQHLLCPLDIFSYRKYEYWNCELMVGI